MTSLSNIPKQEKPYQTSSSAPCCAQQQPADGTVERLELVQAHSELTRLIVELTSPLDLLATNKNLIYATIGGKSVTSGQAGACGSGEQTTRSSPSPTPSFGAETEAMPVTRSGPDTAEKAPKADTVMQVDETHCSSLPPHDPHLQEIHIDTNSDSGGEAVAHKNPTNAQMNTGGSSSNDLNPIKQSGKNMNTHADNNKSTSRQAQQQQQVS